MCMIAEFIGEVNGHLQASIQKTGKNDGPGGRLCDQHLNSDIGGG